MIREVSQNRSIRVIRIIDRLNIGGPAKHVVWLTAGLNGGEFETTLVTGTIAAGEGDMRYFADAARVTPLVIPELSRSMSLSDLFVILKLVRLFFVLRPQIIHTHKAKAGTTGRIAAWIYRWMTPSCLWLQPRRCHVVHTFHGHIFHGYYSATKTQLFLTIERILSRLATDRIITLSKGQYEELVSRFRIGSPSQFRVIPLGIDLQEIPIGPTGLRAEFGIRPEMALIGFVGRLCEVKNLPMLLDVARCLCDQGVTAKFVLIGDGHLRHDLGARVEQLGLTGTVFFTGFRKDVLSLYADMDVVLLTSINEGTPLTLIEAMAAGRALASTEVGGVPDLMGRRRVVNGGFTIWDHGVTARNGDTDGLAKGLRYLLGDPPERQAMGERGRTFVRGNYFTSRLIKDLMMLYRELAS